MINYQVKGTDIIYYGKKKISVYLLTPFCSSDHKTSKIFQWTSASALSSNALLKFSAGE